MKKTIGLILFILTIISPIIFFFIAACVGEAQIFGMGGVIYWMWICYFGAGIALFSLVFALMEKKKGIRLRKNIIASCIVIPINIIFGSYRFIFADSYDYTNKIVLNVEKKAGIWIPENEKTITQKWDSYLIGYSKIVTEKKAFDNTLYGNWKRSLSVTIEHVLPIEIMYTTRLYDYFLFYDCVSHTYNEITNQDIGRDCVFLAYKTASGKLLLLDNYKYRA